MNIVIQILISIILLGFISIVWWFVLILWSKKTVDISQFIPKIKGKKQEAIIFDGEPKTEEEIAIEREERILKTIGSEK
jgi:hypothetical protein